MNKTIMKKQREEIKQVAHNVNNIISNLPSNRGMDAQARKDMLAMRFKRK